MFAVAPLVFAISLLASCSFAPALRAGENVSVSRTVDMANLHYSRGEYPEALASAEQGLAVNAFYPPLWMLKAKILLGMGNYQEAYESVLVSLAAEPDAVETTGVALRILLEWDNISDADRQRRILDFLSETDQVRFGRALSEFVLRRSDFITDLEKLMPAWQASAIGPPLAKQTLAFYLEQQFTEASRLLQNAAAGPEEPYAELCFLVGRILLFDGDYDNSLALLTLAKEHGYDPAQCGTFSAYILRETGHPREAADTLEDIWRSAADPVGILAAIVNNRLDAGEGGKALPLLDAALEAFPRHPALEARKSLIYWATGMKDELARHEEELRAANNTPALGYGRALIFTADGNYAEANRIYAEIKKVINDEYADPLDLLSVRGWLESRHRLFMPAENAMIRNLIPLGRRLWNQKRHLDAIAVWDQAVVDNTHNANALVVSTANMIVAQEMPLQAMLFLRRHLPDMSAVDLAFFMRDNNLWAAAHTLLSHEKKTNPDSSAWARVLCMIAAIRGNRMEAADKDFTDLAASFPPSAPMTLHYVNAGDLLDSRTVPLDTYQELVNELSALVVNSGLITLFPKLIGSGQWDAFFAQDQTDLVVRVGLSLLRGGNDEEAERFIDAIAASCGDNAGCHLILALSALKKGDMDKAASHIEAGLENAVGFQREYLLALSARFRDDLDAASAHFIACAGLVPEDHAFRLEVIRFLVAGHKYTSAAKLAEHYELLYSRGVPDIDYYLALSRGDLGDYEGAAAVWRVLVRRYPNSTAPLTGLGSILNLTGKPQETIDLLSPRTAMHANPEVSALLAEACFSLRQTEEALRWANTGLAENPDNMRLLTVAVGASEALEDYAAMEGYARRGLEQEPESPSMHTLYGQSLLFQEKWDQLAEHTVQLLNKNPRNLGALERESERLKAQDDYKAAWKVDKILAEDFANDPSQTIRAAVTAASTGKFRFALPALERLTGLGPNSPIATLYFSRLTKEPFPGVTSVDRAREQLSVLDGSYRWVGLSALRQGPNPDKKCLEQTPAIIMVGRSSAEALLAFDALLAEKSARAVLVVGEESLVPGTPVWADVQVIQRLANTGRWEFILTDYSPPRLPLGEDKTTAYWTQARWLGSRFESQQETRQRLMNEMDRLKRCADAAGIAVSGWFHPSWGDYGQRIVAVRQDEVGSYREAVERSFSLAFTTTPSGYFNPCGDLLRIPSRTVADALEAQELATSLGYQHPTRRAVLELGKVTSWHGQLSRANQHFEEARDYPLEMREISYFQARNTYYEGDVPTGLDLAYEARAVDPENERTEKAVTDAERLKRPLLVMEPRYWTDSAGEKYKSLEAHFMFHATDKLELRLHGGLHRWEDRRNRMNGESAGVGARYYFRPENYLLADFRGVNVRDGGGSYLEADAVWHGYYSTDTLRANGTFDFEYHREGIEAIGAQEKKIRANRWVANTSTRVANFWDIDANAYYIHRTDSNNTAGMYLRPTYRFKEIPQLRFGYWFAAADSDRNPDEYYAPVGYLAHQAVGMYRQRVTDKLSLTGLASWGRARTEGSGWKTVFRFNAGFAWNVTEKVNISGNYQYLKLPDYTLRQYGLALGIRF